MTIHEPGIVGNAKGCRNRTLVETSGSIVLDSTHGGIYLNRVSSVITDSQQAFENGSQVEFSRLLCMHYCGCETVYGEYVAS